MKHKVRLKQSLQQGFTLLELLVVVSVLATLAGITAVAMDGYERQAQEKLVEVEMKRIASAIYRFKADTGYFPEKGIFPVANSDNAARADLSWLFSSPIDSENKEIMPWDVNAGRGWHGPYIDIASQEPLIVNDIICGLNQDSFHAAFDGNDIDGLTDPFERNTFAKASCVGLKYEGEWQRREYSGQAYLYDIDYENDEIEQCPTGSGCIALISAGKDSQYDTDDDVVRVLKAK